MAESASIRINKLMAIRGLASRREADALITAGKVLINGRPAKIGQTVQAEDKIEVIGETRTLQYFLYYKGRGLVAHSPAAGETDIATRLKADYNLTDIYPVGRLDKASEGLLILTNDGRVTGPLLDTKNEHEREYEVTVDKPIKNQLLKSFARGVTIEGYKTKPAAAKLLDEHRFRLILVEGKKHQIRRMCAALGYQVRRLKRTRIMQFSLGKLKPNQYRKLSEKEVRTFLKTLGVTK